MNIAWAICRKTVQKRMFPPESGDILFFVTFHTCFRNKKTLMLWGFFPNFAATILSAN